MNRTNSKAVKIAVRNYIFDHADFEGYDQQPANPASFRDVAQTIVQIFRSEFRYNRMPSEYAGLIGWMRGLPTALDTCPILYRGSALALVGSWLDQTEAERSKYTEQQAEDLALHLIARELLAAIR